MSKKILAMLLAVCMVVSLMPMAMAADEATLPDATVTVLEPLTLTAEDHDYMVWPSGDDTLDRPLQIVMNFKANETLAEAQAGEYGKWKTDFYLTLSGMAGESITADNCYLAGNYGTYGWIVIPADGMELNNGETYPIVSAYDANLTYENICDYVKDFTAAIYIHDAILKANPALQVKLELKMTNPNDATDVLVVGEPAVYNVNDLVECEAQIGDAYYLSLVDAVADAKDGDTVKMLKDVNIKDNKRLDIKKNITLDLNGFTMTSKDGGGSHTMAVFVNEGVAFNLTDSSEAKTGKIVSSCYGVYVKQKATFNMEGGTIQVSGNDVYDMGVIVWNGAFNMTGGKIEAQYGVWTTDYWATEGKQTGLPVSTASIADGAIDVKAGNYDPRLVVAEGAAELSVTGGTFTGNAGVYKNEKVDEEEKWENLKVISGGIFDADPTECLATGYKATAGEDGKYTVGLKTYTVTYMANGEAIKTITVEHGKSISAVANNPAAPQKEGHSFGGYYADEACTDKWIFDEDATNEVKPDAITADTTLYTKFNANQYTITFDTAGGSAIDAVTADYGTAITAPANPTRGGYTFAGWDTEIPATMPAKDMTITAKWNAIVYIDPTPSTPSTPDPEPEEPTVPETPSVDTDSPVVDSTTTENPDGSTTTTEKLENGATVETTTGADGSKTETATKTETVETEEATTTTTVTATTNTAADGTVSTETKVEEVVTTETTTTATTTTTTETAEKTEKVEVKEETTVAEDGTETTATTTTTETELANGTTATTVVDAAGAVTAEATVSGAALADAAETGAAVPLPVAAVSNADAATITVNTGSTETVTVEIPMTDASAGTVAILVDEEGNETIITETAVTENGVSVPVPDGATIKLVDNSVDFADVNEGEWHKDATDYVSARGIMNGTGEDTFDPKGNTTRAMVWTMLARLDGVDTSAGSNWYEAGQKWAMENGISDGTNASAEVTREQLVTMIWRYLGEPESDHDLSGYEDHHETSEWAKIAKQWAVENGVIKGTTDTTLDPGGDATRAQVAQMFMNFLGL